MKLPSGRLIDSRVFCRLIAEAVCPACENGLDGIACIVAKTVTNDIPLGAPVPLSVHRDRRVQPAAGAMDAPKISQSVLMSEAGQTLTELVHPEDRSLTHDYGDQSLFAGSFPRWVGEWEMNCALSDEDRRRLQELYDKYELYDVGSCKNGGVPKQIRIPILPRLHYPMSEEDAHAFRAAYAKLKERPDWMPVLMSKEREDTLKEGQAQILRQHQMALQREFDEGRLDLVDARNVPAKAFFDGALIARPQAIAYLERCGLEYDDEEAASPSPQIDSETKTDEISQHPDPEQPTSGKTSHRIGEPKASPEQRAAAVRRCAELMASGEKAFVKPVAEQFGVSVRTIHRWNKEQARPC